MEGQIDRRPRDHQDGFLLLLSGGEEDVEQVGEVFVRGRGDGRPFGEAGLRGGAERRVAGQEKAADLRPEERLGEPFQQRYARDPVEHEGRFAAGAAAIIQQKKNRGPSAHEDTSFPSFSPPYYSRCFSVCIQVFILFSQKFVGLPGVYLLRKTCSSQLRTRKTQSHDALLVPGNRQRATLGTHRGNRVLPRPVIASQSADWRGNPHPPSCSAGYQPAYSAFTYMYRTRDGGPVPYGVVRT